MSGYGYSSANSRTGGAGNSNYPPANVPPWHTQSVPPGDAQSVPPWRAQTGPSRRLNQPTHPQFNALGLYLGPDHGQNHNRQGRPGTPARSRTPAVYAGSSRSAADGATFPYQPHYSAAGGNPLSRNTLINTSEGLRETAREIRDGRCAMTVLDLREMDRLEQDVLDDLINALKWGSNNIKSIIIPGRIDPYRATRFVEILNSPYMNLTSLSLSKSSFNTSQSISLNAGLSEENRQAGRRLIWL